MKIKKLVSFMLTIAMVLSMVAALGITASAGVLQGQTLTASTVDELKTALADAADGDTVRLTADIVNYDEYFCPIDSNEYCYTVSNKTITLDIGQYNLYGGYAGYAVLTLDNAVVTIIGTTGTIENYEVGSNAVALKNGAVLNVNSGTVYGGNSGETFLFYNGTVNINGGSVQGNFLDNIAEGTDFESGAVNVYGGKVAAFDGRDLTVTEGSVVLTFYAGYSNISPNASQIAAGKEVKDLGSGEYYRYQVVNKPSTAYLDLESSPTDIKDTKTLDQKYSLTVSTGSYTDVTKVKVEWTLQDITAVRTDNQIWDPDTLSWVTADSVVTANSATASFHLTNLSSVKVDAKVEFAAVAGFDPAVVYTGVDATSHKTTLNTVVTGTDVDTSITHDATVTVKVTPSTTDFTTASATDSAKYGTYTVTLLPASAVYSITSSLDGTIFTADENNPTTIAAGGTAVLKYTIGENYSGMGVIVTVTGADKDEPEHDEANGIVTVTIKNPTGDVTVSVAECLAEGTKITMADRSVKNIEDITTGEMVLTFNHETGKYEGQAVYLAYAGKTPDNGTELTFSDGTTLTIVGEHDLFEQESMKYVTLTRSNAAANIGKHYYNAETGKFVTLTAVNTTAPVNYYSLYTAYNANCIANGMLTVPDDTEYTLNIYEFNDDLTADMAALEEDIATYGIYECRIGASYTREEYDMLRMKYVNVAIGKGLTTMEILVGANNEYHELQK